MTQRVLSGLDDRLLVVVGPCSVHDVDAGLSYAKSLRELADGLAEDLAVVMRVYVEKPRTTVGWTGLLCDPALDRGVSVRCSTRWPTAGALRRGGGAPSRSASG
jgi:3-deoxy-7-phosphoheptulonate synthase